MIKTTYQTPEIRNANDEIVQEGAFGKNTALSNSTNDGWIDYVMNDLEALHDTIGDSAPTLDGNGHVVEPANLAIGDEDGLRIKNNYLKLSGGNVTGTLTVQQNFKIRDNQENVLGGLYVPSTTATQQFLQIYGGESSSAGNARLTLFPAGDGSFALRGYSTDGATSYELKSSPTGNLNWRGYPLAWAKDYLPITGGILSGWLQFSNQSGRIQMNRSSSNNDSDLGIYGGSGYSTGAYLWLHGVGKASQAGYFGLRAVTDGSTFKELQGRPDGTLTWGNKNIFYGDNNINTTYKDGYEINRSNNTLYQWRRQAINAGANYTWTFGKPFDSNVYIILISGNNANVNFTISQTATSATITNNGNVQTLVSMLAIGISAS